MPIEKFQDLLSKGCVHGKLVPGIEMLKDSLIAAQRSAVDKIKRDTLALTASPDVPETGTRWSAEAREGHLSSGRVTDRTRVAN
jgi:hypothetical protein